MNIEEFRIFCLSKSSVTESFPFDHKTLVFKVCNKMFALCSLESENLTVNLKCDPERAIELREEFSNFITPGYHMSKKHWNTVSIDKGLDQDLVVELINHSYDLVVKSLPKKLRETIIN